METLETLAQHPVFRHFFEICRIPHNSHEEKQLSDTLFAWGKKRNLAVWQDARNNLLFRRKASADAADKPGLILQAHLDMVCQKAPGVTHDFSSDPLTLEVNGDLLSTGGRTTLGADDGIGVALGLALLEENLPSHPEIEVLLTTDEEDTFSGADGVDFSKIHGRQLLNLDNAQESHAITGSAGGFAVEWQKNNQVAPVTEETTWISLQVKGMIGGHSGEDIHRGRGDAISLLTRLLAAAEETEPVRIAVLKGGSFRLALARDAKAVIGVAREAEPQVMAALEKEKQYLLREYRHTNPEFNIVLESDNENFSEVLTEIESQLLIQFLLLAPRGIQEMEGLDTFSVRTSANLGELSLEPDHKVKAVWEIRSTFDSGSQFVFQKIKALALLVGGTCRTFGAYPGFPHRTDSPLRERILQVYSQVTGMKMTAAPVHCGLECGCFMAHCPELDCLSIGPNEWNLHSPEESLSISSTLRVYEVLKTLISEMAK
jgi:dipeptidase D